jgi:hypothetical protein
MTLGVYPSTAERTKLVPPLKSVAAGAERLCLGQPTKPSNDHGSSGLGALRAPNLHPQAVIAPREAADARSLS